MHQDEGVSGNADLCRVPCEFISAITGGGASEYPARIRIRGQRTTSIAREISTKEVGVRPHPARFLEIVAEDLLHMRQRTGRVAHRNGDR